MLVIRTEQMKVFEDEALRRFEDEMVAHSRDFAPRLSEVIGDEQLRVAVRSAISRAGRYGWTNRGPIRLFVELTFLCGSAFDDDPQYPAIRQALLASDDQMQRAERVYEIFLDYLDKVSGYRAVNVHNALSELLKFSRTSPVFSNDLAADLLQEMGRIFPQKAQYVGEPALLALIEEGFTEARQYGFESDRHRGLLVVLKFAFGHGATSDPLYPWIARTLNDQKLDPEAKATRLEKKAVTWLEHVVARNERKFDT